jgi:tRNA (adenine57-N1/adenine58-N1)-methyltransferase
MFIYPKIYRKLKRGPQVMLPKDIGIILAYSGVSKESVCMDAGTGSGWLAVSLARICKKVYSYDLRTEFIAIAQRNADSLGLTNIEFRNQDVFQKINERNLDLVVLDLPSSEKALSNAKKALAENGTVVGYLPHMEQVQRFASKLEKLHFSDIHTVEVIVREMLVRKEGMRPSTKGLWHTAYLVFARKPENEKRHKPI